MRVKPSSTEFRPQLKKISSTDENYFVRSPNLFRPQSKFTPTPNKMNGRGIACLCPKSSIVGLTWVRHRDFRSQSSPEGTKEFRQGWSAAKPLQATLPTEKGWQKKHIQQKPLSAYFCAFCVPPQTTFSSFSHFSWQKRRKFVKSVQFVVKNNTRDTRDTWRKKTATTHAIAVFEVGMRRHLAQNTTALLKQKTATTHAIAVFKVGMRRLERPTPTSRT